MKVIGYKIVGFIDVVNVLEDIELDKLIVMGRDILVKVLVIVVNFVDFKICQNVFLIDDEFKVLGWDVVGEVVVIGEEVYLFNYGDKVYYVGDLICFGSNVEYQFVDEWLVVKKLVFIFDVEVVVMLLISIMVWELLFECLVIFRSLNLKVILLDVLLVVGVFGGVGFILIQYVKVLINVVVIVMVFCLFI